MKITLMRGIFLMMALLSLAACRSEHTYYDDSGYYYEEEIHDEYVYDEPLLRPDFEAFYITDSFGTSSAAPSSSLILDPYIDNGWFDISWEVDSWDDYWIEFYLSDNPGLDGAVYIGSQVCGLGFECEEDGLQLCHYSASGTISCDTGEDREVYIDHLLYTLPQTLYFVAQVCDFNFEYCEYRFEPVLMN